MAKLFLRYPSGNTVKLIQIPITEKECKLFLDKNVIKSSPYLTGTNKNLIVKEDFFDGKKVKDKWRYNIAI